MEVSRVCREGGRVSYLTFGNKMGECRMVGTGIGVSHCIQIGTAFIQFLPWYRNFHFIVS